MTKVTVIVTTKNEAANIEDCLVSIKNQSLGSDNIEIIVVDNNSIDSTINIANKFTKKIYLKGPERSTQRNFGVSNATSKYIMYIDADMILSQDVIKECFNECEAREYIALYIPERIIGRGFLIKVRNFERSFYNATVIDCVRFVKREKFLEIGGFDETLTGPEDWDFNRRINAVGKAGIVDAFICHNEGNFSIKRYIRKKKYYINSLNRYIEKWGKEDSIIRKQLGIKYRYFGVFTEFGKWKKLFSHPLLTIGMFYLRFLVGLEFLSRPKHD